MKIPLFLLSSLLIVSSVSASDTPLKVFVFSGQSNMVGMRSVGEELPAEMQKPNPKALFWTGTEWKPIAPGVSEPKGFGPEISFASHYTQTTGETIGIIKHSVGGTPIERWQPKEGKNLYTVLEEKVKAAAKSRPIEVVGMLWMQGERDSKDEEKAPLYEARLRMLVEGSREVFESPQMIFIAGRVNPPKDRYLYVEEVRKAQSTLDIDGYTFIDCDDLELGPDKLHFNTKGVEKMGEKFATAMVEQLEKQK
ncbi:MAG: hypothetical protein CMO55_27690 [Verrucomicrobiales bacterium]|nr:hypothetical protein [Verrucomicrobiales bacterium]